jgi:holliday junction DNA helicase RuvA
LIYFIKGNLFDVKPDSLIIESGGIGYEIFCTTKDISDISEKKGKEVFIYTYLVHKEDAMVLYGFTTEKNKKGFLELLKVDGIGPKLALKILSFYDVNYLFEVIEKEDIEGLRKIPGVGPKMAGKIIFDLKGKLPHFDETIFSNIENDLILSLVNLGYQEVLVKEKLKKHKPLTDNFEAEFKKLLKIMAGNK